MRNLRHQCGPDGCYMDTLWDWSPFNDCFGDSGIRISDLDGMVERNGHFLILDGKRVNPAGEREIRNGHRRLYKRSAIRGDTVIVFHGYPPTDIRFVRQWLPGGEFIQERPCDLAELKDLVAQWFIKVDRIDKEDKDDTASGAVDADNEGAA
jgi:hypothetical protein